LDLYEDLSRIEGLALRKEVDLEIRRWRWQKRRDKARGVAKRKQCIENMEMP